MNETIRFSHKNLVKLIMMLCLFSPYSTVFCEKTDYDSKVLGIEWIKISAGEFQMGSNGGNPNEKPVHTVYLDSYHISKTEVTFAQYDKFCSDTGRKKSLDSGWGRGNRPVIYVSWEDAVAFCKWLSRKIGKNIHLPTEAQWEYAARGGNKSKGSKYSGSNDIESVAWYTKNSGAKTHPVGQKNPNELGIYDMSGNVSEWCSDRYGDNYYSNSPRNNPAGPSSGIFRVYRGGSLAGHCWSTIRYGTFPSSRYYFMGFRLARGQ